MDRRIEPNGVLSPEFHPLPRRPLKSDSANMPLRYIRYIPSRSAQTVDFLGKSLPLSPIYVENSAETYLHQCFDEISWIGEGCFGMVYRARSKDDGKYYAVKKFRDRFRNASHRMYRLKEVERYERVPWNRYCVEFIRAWEENGYLFIQMELCMLNLEQYIKETKNLNEDCLWNIFLDVLLGLKHLHANECVHLDIKPANILVSHENIFKLGDFGLMLDLSQGPVHVVDEGDAKYLAPEVLIGPVSKAADIYSLGSAMLEIIQKSNLPKTASLDELSALAKSMIEQDPEVRPAVEKLLAISKLRKRHVIRYVSTLLYRMVAKLMSWLNYGKLVAANYSRGLIRSFSTQGYSAGRKDDTEIVDAVNAHLREQTPPPSVSPPRFCITPSPSTPAGPSRREDFDLEDTPIKSGLKSCRRRIVFEDSDADSDCSDKGSDFSLEPLKRRIDFEDSDDDDDDHKDKGTESSWESPKRRIDFEDSDDDDDDDDDKDKGTESSRESPKREDLRIEVIEGRPVINYM